MTIGLPRSRRARVALIGVLSLALLFVLSRWMFGRGTPVDLDSAVEEYRRDKVRVARTTEPGASPPPTRSPSPGAPLPVPSDVRFIARGHVPVGATTWPARFRGPEGTYEYETDGWESMKPGGYRRTFPATTHRNVRYTGAQRWEEHHIFLEERHIWYDLGWDDVGRLAYSTRNQISFGRRGVGIDETIRFSPPLRSSSLPWRKGARWTGTFEGDTSGSYTAATLDHGWMMVGGERVEFWLDEFDAYLKGRVDGHVIVRRWLSPKYGIVLREAYDATATVGVLEYRARWIATLRSLRAHE